MLPDLHTKTATHSACLIPASTTSSHHDGSESCSIQRRYRLLQQPARPGAIRIERFIEKRFGFLPLYEELPKGVLGYTQFGSGGVEAIVVSDAFEVVGENAATERRLRTTLAHEAGHALMHAHLFALGKRSASLFDDGPDAPSIFCRDVVGVQAATKGYDGRWWEFQANQAIGGLLMPRALVDAAAQEFLEPAGLLGIRSLPDAKREALARALAELFDVNPVVARIRLTDIFPRHSNQLPL